MGFAMRILLTVIAGPHKGLEFAFDRHDTFLVGRSKHAHFQLPAKDRYFSRVHFMMEVNPPECRLIDMGSHNGTFVNGVQVLSADLKDGDQIRAGHTMLRLRVEQDKPQPAFTSPMPGLPEIPGYVLERELGRGTMGVTYLGHAVKDPMSVAIKVVTPRFPGTPTQIDDFLRSARLLLPIDHPHLVRLRDAGVAPAAVYFVSDYVLGESAIDILARDGALSIPRALRWADQILNALDHAHAKRFMHHDIKPANVLVSLVDGQEVVQLSDFGLARVYQAAPFSGLSVTTAMIEQASFMPPEMLFSYQETNALSDQYAVAAVLYHLLTASPLLDLPKERKRRYTSILRRQHVPIRERRPEVGVGLADAIHKALSRTPGQRFATIRDFRAALTAACGLAKA